MGYTVNYDEARERAQGAGNDLKAFAQGLYVCQIIGYDIDNDNVYNGTPRPTCKFKLKPLKPALGGALTDMEGQPIETVFQNKEGEQFDRFFQFYVSLPLSLGKKTNFSKLVGAIFGNQAPSYEDLDQYIGNTLVADISVTDNMVDDGAGGKKQRYFNKIESLSTDPQNVVGGGQAAQAPVPAAQVPAAPVATPPAATTPTPVPPAFNPPVGQPPVAPAAGDPAQIW